MINTGGSIGSRKTDKGKNNFDYGDDKWRYIIKILCRLSRILPKVIVGAKLHLQQCSSIQNKLLR